MRRSWIPHLERRQIWFSQIYGEGHFNWHFSDAWSDAIGWGETIEQAWAAYLQSEKHINALRRYESLRPIDGRIQQSAPLTSEDGYDCRNGHLRPWQNIGPAGHQWNPTTKDWEKYPIETTVVPSGAGPLDPALYARPPDSTWGIPRLREGTVAGLLAIVTLILGSVLLLRYRQSLSALLASLDGLLK